MLDMLVLRFNLAHSTPYQALSTGKWAQCVEFVRLYLTAQCTYPLLHNIIIIYSPFPVCYCLSWLVWQFYFPYIAPSACTCSLRDCSVFINPCLSIYTCNYIWPDLCWSRFVVHAHHKYSATQSIIAATQKLISNVRQTWNDACSYGLMKLFLINSNRTLVFTVAAACLS